MADGFQEVRHRIPLESLQDVFSVEELEEFDQRMQEALPEGVEYDVEPKVDGLSVALEYETASLCAAPPAAMARWERM